MSGLFQVEPQFYSLGGTTEIDPTHIPEFPVSERLRGIEGRNIVGAPWDQLAAQADNAKQAEERGMALRYASEQTGVPLGHIYAMDRVDPHMFDRVAQNQQGVSPGPTGMMAPPPRPRTTSGPSRNAGRRSPRPPHGRPKSPPRGRDRLCTRGAR